MIYSQKDFDPKTKHLYDESALFGTVKIPRNGVKGDCLLSELVNFPDGVPIDYMHLLCLGLFKTILSKWFDSENHKQDYYIGKLKIL